MVVTPVEPTMSARIRMYSFDAYGVFRVINLPHDANASVTAETINGGIDGSDFGLKANKGFVGRDLEGDIGDGSARLALSTVNGAIKIRSN